MSGPQVTLCWCCDRLLTFGAADRPGPGDLAVCTWCGTLAVLAGDGSTRAPDDETMFVVASSSAWRARYVDALRHAGWRDDAGRRDARPPRSA